MTTYQLTVKTDPKTIYELINEEELICRSITLQAPDGNTNNVKVGAPGQELHFIKPGGDFNFPTPSPKNISVIVDTGEEEIIATIFEVTA